MTSSYKRSLYSSIVRIVANVVMIGAVFLGMYMASRSPTAPAPPGDRSLTFASGKARCPPSPPLWAGARSGGGGLAGRPLFL